MKSRSAELRRQRGVANLFAVVILINLFVQVCLVFVQKGTLAKKNHFFLSFGWVRTLWGRRLLMIVVSMAEEDFAEEKHEVMMEDERREITKFREKKKNQRGKRAKPSFMKSAESAASWKEHCEKRDRRSSIPGRSVRDEELRRDTDEHTFWLFAEYHGH